MSHLKQVATPCVDDHPLKDDDFEVGGELALVCAQIVLKWLQSAIVGRPVIPWTVNTVPRAVTRWNRACDQRCARLIGYIHFAKVCRQFCHVGHQVDCCNFVFIPRRLCCKRLARNNESISGGVFFAFLLIGHVHQFLGCVRSKLCSQQHGGRN